MTMTITELRANLYRVLDEIIATKKPIEIIRKGQHLKIVLEKKKPHHKLAHLKPHPGTICGNPDDLIHLNWSENWQGKDEI
ncbi:MAG: type II toxin-antitoxin system Phd/YefM family antitoxin [Gammaproteobacteria bacterium]|nr:type II toxin-antitoxin system Phd/YefM family antitoxin [Gammaproteobacteria bacterium]